MNSITLTSSMLSATSVDENFFQVMDVSRHLKADTVRGDVRRVEMFKLHAVAGFM
jgi:hypothetical protein